MARLTFIRRAKQERGRQWRHHFVGQVKAYRTWTAPELTGEDNAHDPDWWIDDTTTRAEYNQRNRQHAAKWRDDWA